MSRKDEFETAIETVRQRGEIPVLLAVGESAENFTVVQHAMRHTVPGAPEGQVWFVDERHEVWAFPENLPVRVETPYDLHPITRNNILQTIQGLPGFRADQLPPDHIREFVQGLVNHGAVVNVSGFNWPFKDGAYVPPGDSWRTDETSWTVRFVRERDHLFIITVSGKHPWSLHGFVKHADPEARYPDFDEGPANSDVPLRTTYEDFYELAEQLLGMPIPH